MKRHCYKLGALNQSLRIGFKALLPIFTSIILLGCNGGTGSGDGQSVLGGDGDPFISIGTLAELAASTDFITPIAYIRRPLPVLEDPDDDIDWLDLGRIEPGSRLYIRAGASASANEFSISDAIFGANAAYDVKGVSVSPDGSRLLFAMHAPEDDLEEPEFTWNIWEYNLSENKLSRVISDDFIAEEGNDIDPIYLANGDILFASTRQTANKSILVDEGKSQYSGQIEAEASAPAAAAHTYNLHVIDSEQEITQITFNQSHDFAPMLQNNGKILFSRWDNITGTDQISLYEIEADGSNLALKYGYHSLGSLADSRQGILENYQPYGTDSIIAIRRDFDFTIDTQGGEIVSVDIENFYDNSSPTASNTGLLGNATDAVTNSSVELDNPLSPNGRFLSAWPLNDGSSRALIIWSDCRAIDPSDNQSPIYPCALAPSGSIAATPAFEVWMQDLADQTRLPVVSVTSGEMISEVVAMDPVSIAATVPNIDFDLAGESLAVLNIRSVYDLDGVDIAPSGISANANPAIMSPEFIDAKFLRLVKAVSIPDEDIKEVEREAFGVSTQQLMREIIGYVPIEPDGSVKALIPANIPLMISVVNEDGKRINLENPNTSQRHQNWIHASPGATIDCRGCHGRNSTAPHGRLDAQPASVHPGGPYPNTAISIPSPTGIETMAEIFSEANDIAGRTPSMDLIYQDDWTDDSGLLSKANPFQLNYSNLDTPMPATEDCQSTWDKDCRSVINYVEHIQPLWELTRTPIDDGNGVLVDSCVGCHSTTDLNGNTQVPAAQLDLRAVPHDGTPENATSYRELLRGDPEQVLNGMALADRLWECNQLDEFGQPVIDDTDPLAPVVVRGNFITPNGIGPSMNEAGANFGASNNFFNCLTQDNACRDNIGDTLPAAFPDECIEFAGTPVLMEPTINHNGLLSADELRLISEWLDIGAQYYNNPLDAPVN